MRPSSLDSLELLGLSLETDASSVFVEWHNLLVFQHIFHVSNGLLDLHSLHNSGSLVSVLEVHSHIVSSALSR